MTKLNSINTDESEFNNDDDLNDENEFEVDAKNKPTYTKHTGNSSQIFNLNDFYMRFLPDKFCDSAVKLKRRNKTFSSNDFTLSDNQHTISIFQVS